MTEIQMPETDPELAAAVWDLTPLVGGGDDAARRLMDTVRERATAFAARYRGTIVDLEADELAELARELAAIHGLNFRIENYGFLRAMADSTDPSAGQIAGAGDEAKAAIDTALLFFDLEWVALADDRAEALLDALTGGDVPVHHLRRLRARRPHLLDAEAERVLAETRVQRISAWRRLYTDNTACLTVEVDGQTIPLAQAFPNELSGTDRRRRLAVMAALPDGLFEGLPTRLAAYNQVLGEKVIDDRLRGRPGYLSQRNLENELDDRTVELQLAAIAARRELPRRWNRLKARLLGLDRLSTSDIYAALPGEGPAVSYADACTSIVSAWAAFAPRAGELVDGFFSGGFIDAPIREGKQSGAFCASSDPNSHSYILTNFDERPVSVMMLAHELGHGLNAELARARSPLEYGNSPATAEIASTFSEALVAELLLSRGDDAERLALLAARLDDAMRNVFLSSTFLQFEMAVAARRRDEGELTAEQMTDIWRSVHQELWEDTVEIQPGYELLWSFYPHTIWFPGYFYAYSFGLLSAWSMFARYREAPEAFRDRYLAMLAAGSSAGARDLIAMVGLELDDPGYWSAGLDLLDGMLIQAEHLADAL